MADHKKAYANCCGGERQNLALSESWQALTSQANQVNRTFKHDNCTKLVKSLP